MKIGISTSVIQRGKTGIAHYLFALLNEFQKAADKHEFVLFVLEEDLPLFDFLNRSMEIVLVPERFRPAVANIRWHQLTLPRLARKLNLDALHVPSYRRLLYNAPCPRIGTIHDLAPFRLSGKYDWARMIYGKHVVRQLARRQDALIAVSQSTADDIAKFFGIASSKIDVIHNGLNHDRFHPRRRVEDHAALARFALDVPYFLYVARLEHPGKNHVRLIHAFEDFKRATNSKHLLVLGGSDWHGAEAIHQAAEKSPFARDIRRVGYVSDDQLPALYRGAAVMCYPSLFEGFGMPPVEAMACNCPVISSARGSLGEIASPAACTIDPENVSEMADALRRVALDASFADGLRRKGLEHSSRFNWRRAAQATLSVYERFAHKTSRDAPAKPRELQPA